MLAWAFHRISGVAIWLFVVLHVIDIYLVGGDPKAYNTILQVYASPRAGRPRSCSARRSCTTRSTACGSSSSTCGRR